MLLWEIAGLDNKTGYVVRMKVCFLTLCNRGPVELKSENKFEQYKRELKEDFGGKGYCEWPIPIMEIRECQRVRRY